VNAVVSSVTPSPIAPKSLTFIISENLSLIVLKTLPLTVSVDDRPVFLAIRLSIITG